METVDKTETARLGGASLDIAREKQRQLLDLFPEARTEGAKIDFDRLRLVLGEAVDAGKERYGLSWPGKVQCFKTIQTPSMATLLPCPDKSLKFDTSENLIIEGDNLEVLKLLQKSYLGKVKMIYIDPPYNTGNDFIYPDDYSETLQTYLQYTGQVDMEGKKFGTNSDTDGRFHSKWLNMMYPRLYLANNLLTDDGVIFLSIDDHEVFNARMLMNEIFGEENFVEQIVWKKRYNAAKEKHLASIHEYILVYARDKENVPPIYVPANEEYTSKYYTNRDENYEKRGGFFTQPLEAGKSMDSRPNLVFAIPAPDGTEVWPKRQWVWGKERVIEALNRNELRFKKDKAGKWSIRFKQYERDADGEARGVKPFSIVDDVFYQEGTKEIEQIFGEPVFAFPKPSALIRKLMQFANVQNRDIVLDLFAGSGTTGQSVLDLNAQDGGDRSFILVQLPEPTGRTDYSTIASIAEERVRRVIAKLDEMERDALHLSAGSDRGFRVFDLAQSNVKEWDSTIQRDPEALTEQLRLNVEHLRDGRDALDIVFEVLLKSGYPPSAKIAEEMIEGKRIYSVGHGAFLICLDRSLTLELLRAMAARKPERVLLLDEGFSSNDQLKVNAVQTFTAKNIVLRTL